MIDITGPKVLVPTCLFALANLYSKPVPGLLMHALLFAIHADPCGPDGSSGSLYRAGTWGDPDSSALGRIRGDRCAYARVCHRVRIPARSFPAVLLNLQNRCATWR